LNKGIANQTVEYPKKKQSLTRNPSCVELIPPVLRREVVLAVLKNVHINMPAAEEMVGLGK
jgi:hypothetical protein